MHLHLRDHDHPLTPSRALLHPLWLGALAVLVLNDHVLKGAGLLPGVVTGKVSDLAGMLVAPLLLASLLRIRSRRGWLGAHLLVGAVFSAIQVSAPAADAWSFLMGLVGFPWAITRDPTDLMALPLLGLSLAFFPTVMRERSGHLVRVAARWGAAAGGLAATVATSPPPSDPLPLPEDTISEIFTDIYVHNGTEQELVVRIRPLRESVDLDCEQVAQDPGALLPEPLFGDAQSWTVRANANVAVFDRDLGDADISRRPCWAALVDADNVAPRVLFWMAGQPPATSISGEGYNEDDNQGISISFDDEDIGVWESELDVVFGPGGDGEAPGACEPQPEADRIEWSGNTPTGEWTLGRVDPGLDGCYAIELRSPDLDPEEEGKDWFLCVPRGSFPFSVDDHVRISGSVDSRAAWITLLETDSLDVASPGLEMMVGRHVESVIFGLTVALVPKFDCTPSPEPECGTVARPFDLVVSGAGSESVQVEVDPNAPAVFRQADGADVSLYLAHLDERFVLDPECAAGPDTLGTDMEFVAVRAGAQQ